MDRQIVLISGCSSGIGLATAVFLAKDAQKRFKVYATMRNLEKKGQLEEEGKEYLGDTLVIKAMDVSNDESVQKTVEEVLDTEGRIDVLFITFTSPNAAQFGATEGQQSDKLERASVDAQKRFKVYATMRNLAKKGQLEEEGKEYLGDSR
ncbi:Retinol dehydrogenase 8 [Stylophora pistillata]|uniref:Retinol dehydrogenase 8 n=1 Tax=Stylophora pistillata TaxID=50429 RepID=A0A2B4SNX0_STYPI|nr:Retinol dehydrogenase 8 [Stylophora pistillata]